MARAVKALFLRFPDIKRDIANKDTKSLIAKIRKVCDDRV